MYTWGPTFQLKQSGLLVGLPTKRACSTLINLRTVNILCRRRNTVRQLSQYLHQSGLNGGVDRGKQQSVYKRALKGLWEHEKNHSLVCWHKIQLCGKNCECYAWWSPCGVAWYTAASYLRVNLRGGYNLKKLKYRRDLRENMLCGAHDRRPRW